MEWLRFSEDLIVHLFQDAEIVGNATMVMKTAAVETPGKAAVKDAAVVSTALVVFPTISTFVTGNVPQVNRGVVASEEPLTLWESVRCPSMWYYRTTT